MVERSSLLMRFSFENERSPEHAVVIMAITERTARRVGLPGGPTKSTDRRQRHNTAFDADCLPACVNVS